MKDHFRRYFQLFLSGVVVCVFIAAIEYEKNLFQSLQTTPLLATRYF